MLLPSFAELLLSFVCACTHAHGSPAGYRVLQYEDQLVNHADPFDARRFSQRYFEADEFFVARRTSGNQSGSPIFVIIGGEGSLDPQRGIFYPWVQYVLAKRFGALVVQPEHRFYGTSQPTDRTTGSSWAHLMTPDQALADLVRFIAAVRQEKGCRVSPGSAEEGKPHCPVITFGGSYPGWLSAMARLRYPAVVDGAYAGSAPVVFYAQGAPEGAYYKKISESAELSKAGCWSAAARAFEDLEALVFGEGGVVAAVQTLNICSPMPEYIETGGARTFFDEVMMVFMYSFANMNMGYYPPRKDQPLARACEKLVVADKEPSSRLEALREILAANVRDSLPFHGSTKRRHAVFIDGALRQRGDCASLQSQLPAGANGTITCGDWSGCGVGEDGQSWDLQTSSLLVERIGTEGGVNDMFPKRTWSLDWIREHARRRNFGCSETADCVRPTELTDLWGFGDAEAFGRAGASRIIFTNGLVDGWSAGGVLTSPDVRRDLISINLPNGAHHSDLGGHIPSPELDTPDVLAGQALATELLAKWLQDARKTEGAKGQVMLI